MNYYARLINAKINLSSSQKLFIYCMFVFVWQDQSITLTCPCKIWPYLMIINWQFSDEKLCIFLFFVIQTKAFGAKRVKIIAEKLKVYPNKPHFSLLYSRYQGYFWDGLHLYDESYQIQNETNFFMWLGPFHVQSKSGIYYALEGVWRILEPIIPQWPIKFSHGS